MDAITKAEYTHKYFWPEEGCEIITQVPIFFNYRNVECKSLLDGLIIDHNKKTIQPYDLKTSAWGVRNFRAAYRKFKYYTQAAFYTYAVAQHFRHELELTDYEVLPFDFVVAGVKLGLEEYPAIYRVEPQDIVYGMEKIDEAIEKYKWHIENSKFEMTKEQYDCSSIF